MNNINWTKWSSIAEIVSSIAILITLIYLGIQTQQNTAAVEANTRNMMLTSDLTIVDLMIANPGIEISMAAQELSIQEQVKLENFLIGLLRTREHQWFQYKNGQLDEDTWRSYQSALVLIFSYPQPRQWFHNIHEVNAFDKEFMDSTVQMLETVPVRNEYFNHF